MFDPANDHTCEVLSPEVHRHAIANFQLGMSVAIRRANACAQAMKTDPLYRVLFSKHLSEIKSAKIAIRIHTDCLRKAEKSNHA